MRVGVLLVILGFGCPAFADTHTTAITITPKTKSIADIARESAEKRTGKCRVYTDKDLSVVPQLAVVAPSPSKLEHAGVALPSRPTKNAAKDAARLKALCRAAGADASYPKPVQTDVYIVNGKKVTVTGQHANPKEIQRAKEICRDAMAADAELSSTAQR